MLGETTNVHVNVGHVAITIEFRVTDCSCDRTVPIIIPRGSAAFWKLAHEILRIAASEQKCAS